MTDPATAAIVAGWTDWLALGLALAFTAGCILLAWRQSHADLKDAQHELVLDELWGPDEDWIEEGRTTIPAEVLREHGSVVLHGIHGGRE